MTTISDRAAVSLALECASRLRSNGCVMDGTTGSVEYLTLSLDEMLEKADAILAWHDRRCSDRASRDALRVNAPKVELHPSFKGS